MIKYIKLNWNGTDRHEKDKELYNYLNEYAKSKKRALSIIDVGGAAGLRIPEYTTHILDFQPEKLDDDDVYKFGGDMELHETWIPIFEYVKKNGKFDFVTCTHTLEDLNNPLQVIRNMQLIANAGFIAVPTKFVETRKWEGHYMGYHHHRWIYTIRDGELYMYPKMGLMENVNFSFASDDQYNSKFPEHRKQTEFSFIWEKDFPVQIIYPYQYNDNFTHPTKESKLIDLMRPCDIDQILINE